MVPDRAFFSDAVDGSQLETETMTIAATVERYLAEKGVEYKSISHPVTGSSHETAEAAHVDEGHIAKAVILRDDQRAVMAIVPGNAWVSLSSVGKGLDRELVLLEEDAAAGYFTDGDPGAIAPLGPAYGMETLLDEALVSLSFVYLESGDHRTLLQIDGGDFLKLLGGVSRGNFCHEE